MATHYIGNVPSHGEFKKADSIVSSFNGTLTQFDLDYNTVNQTVGDATQLIVSLNGIIQEPGTAYTLGIGGGSIVFASAPASTDTCHIVLLGGVGGTTTPTDGSVTASKLDSNLKDYLEETFTADGTQTDFTLTRAVVGANTLLVTIDGIVQPSSAFTASGTTLTISEVLAVNTNVRVVHMGVKAGVYVPANDSVTADMLANSINTDIAAGVAALPKAGGTMTGALTTTGLTVNTSSASLANFNYIGANKGSITTDGINLKHNATANMYFNVNSANRMQIGGNGDISFYEDTGTTAKFFWDASAERLGLGTTSPQGQLAVSNAATTDVMELDTSPGFSRFMSIDRTTGDEKYLQIRAKSIGFALDSGTDDVTIDSSGNLLVGNTTTGLSSAGVNLHANGTFELRRDLGSANVSTVGYISRGSTDGNILQFYKNTTHIGSIGTNGDRMNIGTGDAGLRFDNTNNAILPWNMTTDSGQNGTISLGAVTNYQFKDLYLSGGIQFDSRSNKLDDYEEGTFTPTVVFGSGSSGITYSVREGKYTKIGNTVQYYVQCSLSSKGSSTGNLSITGLPFTNTDTASPPSILTGSFTNTSDVQIYLNAGGAVLNLENRNTGTQSPLSNSNVNNNSTMFIAGVYRTSQ